jgi:hypothetical protein
MKKVLLGFMLLGALSCSKDSAEEKSINEIIIGKWIYEGHRNYLNEVTIPSGCGLTNYISFSTDMKMTTDNGSKDSNGNCIRKTNTIDYKINNRTLTKSFYNKPTDKMKTEIVYEITGISDYNKIEMTQVGYNHYKDFNGVLQYITDSYDIKTMGYITYSKVK